VRGAWKKVQGRVEADENCRRIGELTKRVLHEVARDASGWEILYLDPSDGRYWELTYPESSSHGGGPPKLKWLSQEDVRKKYGKV